MQRLVLLFIVMAVLGAIAIGELRQRWAEPLVIPETGFNFLVEPGDSLRTVAELLHKAGVLHHPELAILWGRWTGLDQQIKPGEYVLPVGSTAGSMLLLLQSGDVIQYQVTFPEGITLAKAMGILKQQAQLTITMQSPADPRLLELIEPHTQPEGLFFPDSYRYSRGDTDLSILQRAHVAMRDVLHEEWRQRAAGLPYDNAYEALIMASIIERETGLPHERAQIAGVFTRRLVKGMRLQTDPTVIYGLGNEFDGNLQRKHLIEDGNSYNTYLHAGLPPTPIALPGRAAIHAAMHPGEGSDLYFVARGDGGHVFSDNLSDHNKAVREYQLRRREDYRSTPGKTQ